HSPLSSPPLRPPDAMGLGRKHLSERVEAVGARPRGLPLPLGLKVAAVTAEAAAEAVHPESLLLKMVEACRREGVVLDARLEEEVASALGGLAAAASPPLASPPCSHAASLPSTTPPSHPMIPRAPSLGAVSPSALPPLGPF
ncbi:unnamed protein product, partial [Laminaria digitata]